MFSLNHSGIDCTGLSEVQLVLDQQTNINQLLTLWKRITYLNVPKILYDAGKIDSSTLDKAMEAMVGSFVPVDAEGVDEMRNFGALFYEMPRPQVPEAIISFISRLEADAAFQSALAEAARGQVAGAKTATEMAIIDAQMRTRLATREGHLNTALEDVAAKMFYLMQRYMKKPKMVRLSGSDLFTHLGTQQLKQLQMDFEMVSYNPIRKNPAVLLETLQAMIPLLAQAPNVDMFKLFEELVSGLGCPTASSSPRLRLGRRWRRPSRPPRLSSSRSPRAAPPFAKRSSSSSLRSGPAVSSRPSGQSLRLRPVARWMTFLPKSLQKSSVWLRCRARARPSRRPT
jgi:hypothetical protein